MATVSAQNGGSVDHKDEDGQPRRIIRGYVDGFQPGLSPYGDCRWDTLARARPFRRELLRAALVLRLSKVVLSPSGSSDERNTHGAAQLAFRAPSGGPATISSVAGDSPGGHTVCDDKPEARFRATPDELLVELGAVYELTKKRIKACDAVDFSEDETRDDADPEGHLAALGKHWMRHNQNIPCFGTDGTRMEAIGPELYRELRGRWVNADVDLVIWHSDDGRQERRFRVRRLDVIASEHSDPTAQPSLSQSAPGTIVE